MFSSPSQLEQICAVIIGLLFVILCVWFTNKLFTTNTKDLLVRFILLVFAALVGVFIVDKVIAFKMALLSDEQNNQLFDLIKTLTLMIFSYYFGTEKTKKE